LIAEALRGRGVLALQRGQRLDGLAGLLFGETQIVQALRIEPELRAGSKEMGEAQRRIPGNAARSIQNLRHAVGRHAKLAPVPRRSCPTRSVPQPTVRRDE
jgi:hypothetical protein